MQGGNSNTGVCANRFFLNPDNSTAECLDLHGRIINVMGDMLFKLNSTHRMVDVPEFRRLAALVFQYYSEVILMMIFS